MAGTCVVTRGIAWEGRDRDIRGRVGQIRDLPGRTRRDGRDPAVRRPEQALERALPGRT